MREIALQFLLGVQNPDGGWGAREKRRSNTEATAHALLGLHSANDPTLNQSIDRGLSFLAKHQLADGSWPFIASVANGSWTTGLVIFTLTALASHEQRALRGATWLLEQRGWQLGWLASLWHRWAPQKMPIRLNPNLEGWSWTPGAFSFVEPTAYALLALKKLRPRLQIQRLEDRIHQGELLIYDRMCHSGGWNCCGSGVLDKELYPYPDTTALALIALQDHHTADANKQSLHALHDMLAHVQSGLTLSWAILCFALYGQEVSQWQGHLTNAYEKTEFLGETKTFALALLASSQDANSILRV